MRRGGISAAKRRSSSGPSVTQRVRPLGSGLAKRELDTTVRAPRDALGDDRRAQDVAQQTLERGAVAGRHERGGVEREAVDQRAQRAERALTLTYPSSAEPLSLRDMFGA